MHEFPKMLYRKGEHMTVPDAEAESAAKADGWRNIGHPLDHDGDGKPGGSPAGEQATRRRGRKPRQ